MNGESELLSFSLKLTSVWSTMAMVASLLVIRGSVIFAPNGQRLSLIPLNFLLFYLNLQSNTIE